MVEHHLHALTVDCLLETFVMEVGAWDLSNALRAKERQRIMPMRLELGSNALHCAVIAKHLTYPQPIAQSSSAPPPYTTQPNGGPAEAQHRRCKLWTQGHPCAHLSRQTVLPKHF